MSGLRRGLPGIGVQLALLATWATCLSACHQAPSVYAQALRESRGSDSSPGPAPKPADRAVILREASLEGLTPLITGPGIVVCEPVVGKVSSGVSAFGAGCGRWLHFTVGGRGEFPQTPFWQDLPRTQRELGRKDLRLDVSDGAALRRITGTTHAAFGTISGSAANCRLSYRLWDIVHKRQVGDAIVVAGSIVAVRAKLPELADRLAARLGAKKPDLVVAAPSVADLVALGRAQWDRVGTMTAEQDRDLNRLAARLAPAGLILIDRYHRRERNFLLGLVPSVMKQAPKNALVVAEAGYLNPTDFGESRDAAGRLQNEFPDNAILMAAVSSWCTKTLDAPVDAIQAAKEAVRAAPQNPAMWHVLFATYDDVAETVRKGRYWSELTPDEADFCIRLYRVGLAAARKAVALDPQYAEGWYGVAYAATMDSDADLAERSLRRSLQMDPEYIRALGWALNISRSVWFGDQPMRDRIVREVVSLAKASPEPQWFFSLASQVRDLGYPHESAVLVRLAAGGYRKMLEADPANVNASNSLSNALEWQNDLSGAIRVAKAATKRSPNSTKAWASLGYLCREASDMGKAAQAYGQAVRLDPYDSVSRRDLAFALLWRKKPAEAEAAAREGIRLEPEYWRNYSTLGSVLTEVKRPDDAIPQFERAIALNARYYRTVDGESEAGLSNAYFQKKMANEAIEHAKKAIGNHPVEGVPHMMLGDAYALANRDQEAVQEYTTGIKSQPDSPNTHLKRGKLFLKLGRKAEAIADWRETIRSAPGSDAAREAQDLLAKYP